MMKSIDNLTTMLHSQKPKIAIIVTSVFMVRFFLIPHLMLLARDHDVTLMLKNDAPDILAGMDLPVRIIEISIERKVSPFKDLIALFEIYRICRREKFVSVHTITPKAGLLGTLGAFAAKVPIRIHTFQGEVWSTSTGMKRTLFRLLDKLVAWLSTNITVVSHSEKDFLIKEKVVSVNKTQVLGAGSIGGVDLDRFSPNPIQRKHRRQQLDFAVNEIIFTYVGRLCADKGLLILVDAFAKLLPKRNDIKLFIIGPDEDGMTNSIKAKINDLRGGAVTVLPFTNEPEKELIAADILVLPSFREGFGVVLIEGAALGIPSLGSNIYGITDAIVDGETGLLFTVGDVNDLSQKMEQLANSRTQRDILGQKAQQRVVEHFSREKILAEFQGFYASLPYNSFT